MPQVEAPIEDEDVEVMERFLAMLEDCDDVQNVYHNARVLIKKANQVGLLHSPKGINIEYPRRVTSRFSTRLYTASACCRTNRDSQKKFIP